MEITDDIRKLFQNLIYYLSIRVDENKAAQSATFVDYDEVFNRLAPHIRGALFKHTDHVTTSGLQHTTAEQWDRIIHLVFQELQLHEDV